MTTGGTELKKKFATQTHTITLLLEKGDWYEKKLESPTQENEKLKEDTAE